MTQRKGDKSESKSHKYTITGGAVNVEASLLLQVDADTWPDAAKGAIDVLNRLDDMLNEHKEELKGLHMVSYKTCPLIKVKLDHPVWHEGRELNTDPPLMDKE